MVNEKYVLVKHKKGSSMTFLFKLKKGVKAKVGDIAICNTMNGDSVGVISEIFASPKMLEDDLARKYGAYLPIKECKYALPAEIYTAIASSLLKNVNIPKILSTLNDLAIDIEKLSTSFEENIAL